MRFFASSLIAAASLFAAASASAQTPPAAPAPAAPAPAAPAAQAGAPLAPYAAPYPYVVPYYLPPMERRSKAMMTTGIIAWVGGAVATVAGSVVFIQGVGSVCVETADGGAPTGGVARRAHRARGERIGSARQAFDSCGGHPDLGFAILTAGQLVSLGGIPLFVLGNMKIPVRHPTDEGSLAPAVNVGLGGVDLSWKF